MYSVKKIKILINEKRLNALSYFRKLRIRCFIDPLKICHLKPTIKCEKKWYGGSYGGFYVNPDLINKDSIVYSFGIGIDISFDRKIISKHKCRVFGFDPTPKSIDYINSLPKEPLFSFFDFGISTKSGIEKFFLPKDRLGVSGSLVLSDYVNEKEYISVNMKTFNDIIKELGHRKIDIVKLDIEGAEYEVIQSLFDTPAIIRQILVEFHDRNYPQEIKSKQIVEFLRNKGYQIFGASINYEEISFIKID